LQYENGEIIISPKIIYWIEIPSVIGNQEKFDLLKNDIFVIEYDGDVEKLPGLVKSKSKYSGYFYNLENMIKKNNIHEDDIISFSLNIATFINGFMPDKSLVHTSMILEDVAKVFHSNTISYIETNLTNKKSAYSLITKMLFAFFSENERSQRAAIRLILSSMKYKVEIFDVRIKRSEIIYAYIKDISLNGICIILKNKDDLVHFKLKDIVQVKVYLSQSILKIDACFVTRINSNNNEIGINFNINDVNMINEENSIILTSLVYNWLRGIINKYGKIEA